MVNGRHGRHDLGDTQMAKLEIPVPRGLAAKLLIQLLIALIASMIKKYDVTRLPFWRVSLELKTNNQEHWPKSQIALPRFT